MINDDEGGKPYNGGGESGDREVGTVNTINLSRGFGFLKLNNGEELFFHNNQIRNCDDIRLLREGDRVEFTLGPDAKNPSKNEAKDAHCLVDVSGRRKLQDRPPPRSYRSRTPPRGFHDSRDPYAGGGRHGYSSRGRERDFYHESDRYAPPDRYYERERGRGGYDDYPPRSGRDGPPPHRGGSRGYGGGARDRYSGAHEAPPYYDRPSRDYGEDRYMRGRERSPPPRDHDDRRGRSPAREEGTVKTLTEKGYGFVDLRGSDYFFPAKEVLNAKFDELKVGEPVSCIIVRDPRDPTKWQAQRIRKAHENGRVESLKNGFGYLQNDFQEKIFFHKRHLVGVAFDVLQEGTEVTYKTVSSHSRRGTYEAQQVQLAEDAHFSEDPNEGENQEEMNGETA